MTSVAIAPQQKITPRQVSEVLGLGSTQDKGDKGLLVSKARIEGTTAHKFIQSFIANSIDIVTSKAVTPSNPINLYLLRSLEIASIIDNEYDLSSAVAGLAMIYSNYIDIEKKRILNLSEEEKESERQILIEYLKDSNISLDYQKVSDSIQSEDESLIKYSSLKLMHETAFGSKSNFKEAKDVDTLDVIIDGMVQGFLEFYQSREKCLQVVDTRQEQLLDRGVLMQATRITELGNIGFITLIQAALYDEIKDCLKPKLILAREILKSKNHEKYTDYEREKAKQFIGLLNLSGLIQDPNFLSLEIADRSITKKTEISITFENFVENVNEALETIQRGYVPTRLDKSSVEENIFQARLGPSVNRIDYQKLEKAFRCAVHLYIEETKDLVEFLSKCRDFSKNPELWLLVRYFLPRDKDNFLLVERSN